MLSARQKDRLLAVHESVPQSTLVINLKWQINNVSRQQ